MKRRRQGTKTRKRRFRVWTHTQAEKALPYITSIVRSLREHFVEARSHHVRAERRRSRPGRPDREALLAIEEAAAAAARAEEQFEQAGKELWRLNIYLLDPVRGLALIPFAHPEERLAWFVFDLFAPETLGSWRYHEDPLEARRPLSELLPEPPASPERTLVV